MRRALIVLLVACCGCDCGSSHRARDGGGLDAPADAGADAPMDAGVDAPMDAGADAPMDAGPDAPDAFVPECRVACEAPSVVLTIAPSRDPDVLPIGVAVRGHDLGVLFRAYHYRDGNDFPYYGLAHVDLEGPSAGPVTAATSVDTYSLTVAGGLQATTDGFTATVWRQLELTRLPPDVQVGAARWSLDGALVAEYPDLGGLADPLARCGCRQHGTAFGTATGSIAAVVHGDTLWLLPVDQRDPFAGEAPIPFAVFDGAPPRTTPISGVALPDDRVAIAGGGYASGVDPRDAFLVLGRPGEPTTTVPLPGERFDPPPLLAADGDRIFTFRFTSEARDLARSRLVAEQRDGADGHLVATLALPTLDGLVPLATSAYRGLGGAGLAWVEPGGDLRVLPSPTGTDAVDWTECASIATPGIASLAEAPSLTAAAAGGAPMLAVGAGDGLDPSHGEAILLVTGASGAVHVISVPACHIER